MPAVKPQCQNASRTLISLRPRCFHAMYMYNRTYIAVRTLFHVEHFSLMTADATALFAQRLERPSHARRVVGDAKTSARVQQNHAAMPVHARLQIVDRLGRDPLWKRA